jgi:hypothetical protein
MPVMLGNIVRESIGGQPDRNLVARRIAGTETPHATGAFRALLQARPPLRSLAVAVDRRDLVLHELETPTEQFSEASPTDLLQVIRAAVRALRASPVTAWAGASRLDAHVPVCNSGHDHAGATEPQAFGSSEAQASTGRPDIDAFLEAAPAVPARRRWVDDVRHAAATRCRAGGRRRTARVGQMPADRRGHGAEPAR